ERRAGEALQSPRQRPHSSLPADRRDVGTLARAPALSMAKRWLVMTTALPRSSSSVTSALTSAYSSTPSTSPSGMATPGGVIRWKSDKILTRQRIAERRGYSTEIGVDDMPIDPRHPICILGVAKPTD